MKKPLKFASVGAVTVLVGAVVIPLSGALSGLFVVPASSVGSGCAPFLTAVNATQAFCDTLGQPDPTAGTRSGQLNGVLWGVSRSTQNVNGSGTPYAWPNSQQNQCGTTVSVNSTNDVNMCNSQLVESLNDGGEAAELAMYPRQPFDFAGRTGTVEFNVSDDSEGGHAAWPQFEITDQPVPAPNDGTQASTPGLFDVARNSVTVAFEDCPGNPPNMISASIMATSNYQSMNVTSNLDGCVTGPAPTAAGSPTKLMHVEVQVNSSGVKVFMSNAGDPSSTQLIQDAEFQVPLTRGLVWLQDVHYNGCKFNNQCDHTFGWSDLAFDGPVLPRDLGFDVPDSNPSGGILGYFIPGDGTTLTLHPSNPVTADEIAAASGALVEFNYYPENSQTFTVSVNGAAPVQMAMPSNLSTFGSQTIAIPIPVSDLTAGSQTISIKTSDPNGDASANYNLILQAAGGTVNPAPPPAPPPIPVLRSGRAMDVGVGADGSAWVIGTNPVLGGFGIWHWTGSSWAELPGGGVAIAVDTRGQPWVVNSLHQIYHWSGVRWILLPGAGNDVGVGADGSAWVIGTNAVLGGFGIWHWTGSSWAELPGGGVAIAVDTRGQPWVVNSLHQIYHWSGVRWILLPGAGNDVGVGADGSAWVIGTNAVPGGFGIWHWTGSSWIEVSGGAARIAVGEPGRAWVVNASHDIFSY